LYIDWSVIILIWSRALRHFAGAEHRARISQGILHSRCGRVRITEHAPRGPCRVLERRHGLAEIVERGVGVQEERRRIQLLVLFTRSARNILIPLWAVYMSCWTTLYLENWKDREAWKATEWGMSDFSVTERARPKFEGREIHSSVTGLPELYFPAKASFVLRAKSYGLLFCALLGAWLVFFALFAMNSYLGTRPISHRMESSYEVYEATGRYIGTLLTQVIMAIVMVLFGYAYSRLARVLNEMENHKTETAFENHLIGKVFVVHLFVAFGPLLFIATFGSSPTKVCWWP